MSDNPDENDWRESPRALSHEAPGDDRPMAGRAQDDPRSPVRKLLDLFALPDEREEAFTKALLAIDEAEGEDPPPVEERQSEVIAEYARGDVPKAPPDPNAAPVTQGASGADAQLSMPKVQFPYWHITPKMMPSEFDNPLRVDLADTVEGRMPEIAAVVEEDHDESDWWIADVEEEPGFRACLPRYWTKINDAQLLTDRAAHVRDGVEERISKIKTARALMPFIEEGKKAGQLQKVTYTTVIGGADSPDVGWMFIEPAASEYGLWFKEQLDKRYRDLRAEWESLPANDPAKKSTWGKACVAASAIVIAGQEAAPSGINTYDSRVLSWGIGLAAPGLLQKVMYFLVQDPKVWKVFYCCGFMYGAEVRTAKGSQDQYHGVYQIVDVDKKAVVYGDNFHHRTTRTAKKGELQGKGFLALRAFVRQRELLHMLVQVARDPETRDVVFDHNYRFIAGAANVRDFEHIHSEALYVFVAQVQHNWGIGGRDIVRYAMSTEPGGWAMQPASPEKDKVIAKGVVRMVARVLQEERFQSAVKALNQNKYPPPLSNESYIWEFRAATEWGPLRMLEHYWIRLQKGQRSQDGSKVEIPDFMVPVTSPASEHYLWRARGEPLAFDLGPAANMDLRFADDEVAVLEAAGPGFVKVGRRDASGAWKTEVVSVVPRR